MAIIGPVKFFDAEQGRIQGFVWYDNASSPPNRISAFRGVNTMPLPARITISNRATGDANVVLLAAGLDTGQQALPGGRRIYYDYTDRANPGTWSTMIEYPAV